MPVSRTPKTTKPKARKGKIPSKPVVHIDLSDTETPAATRSSPEPAKSKVKSLSGLDAAAQVLREVGEPMNAQDLIARILERGLWKTGGKTPAATIYAAMIREIKAKGTTSRFQKVDRGRFAAAG